MFRHPTLRHRRLVASSRCHARKFGSRQARGDRHVAIAPCRAQAFASLDEAAPLSSFAYEDRDAVMRAMEELNLSATAAEVATKTGLPLSESTRVLQWLVLEAHGSIKVTEAGDLIYSVPPNCRQAVLVHNAQLRTEAAARATAATALRAAKWTFAATLYASIAFCALLLVFLAIAASSSDSDSRSSRRGPALSFNFFPDFWWYETGSPRRRRGARRRQSRSRSRSNGDGDDGEWSGMGFMAAITAWVFGEGDANAGFDAARWAAAGKYVEAHGGVVTAEEMRPFLDAPAPGRDDEADVLPLVVRLGGEAIIDDGHLLYRFPELQKRARGANRRRGATLANRIALAVGLGGPQQGIAAAYGGDFIDGSGEHPIAHKRELRLTSAAPGQVLGIQALAALNAVLIFSAWSAAATPGGIAALLMLSPAAPAVVLNVLLPFFSLYALSYELGPLSRWVSNFFRNRRIARENAARAQAAQVLAHPTPQLRAKLLRARDLGASRNIAADSIVFDSERSDLADAVETDDWDRRFRQSRSQR